MRISVGGNPYPGQIKNLQTTNATTKEQLRETWTRWQSETSFGFVERVKEEIKTIGPKVVVTLGTMALSGIGLKLPLGNVHGKVFHFGDYSLLPTYHPAHGQSDPQIGSIINLELAKIKELLAQKNEEA